MTSMITSVQAKRLLTETIKACPRIKNPPRFIAHAEFIGELVQSTINDIREAGIKFNVNDDEMKAAAYLHDIGYCFAENPYLHPHTGGEFLRNRGFPRIGKIIETHTYAPEAVLLIGYKGNKDPRGWMPIIWNQVLIDYASLHAGEPGEVINHNTKFDRFKMSRDEIFQDLIEHAEPRLRREVDEVNALKRGEGLAFSTYEILKEGGEFQCLI